MRAEDQDTVTGLQKGLREVLLDGLRPRGGHDVFRADIQAKLIVNHAGRRRAELGQPQTGAVAGLVLLDRPDARVLGVRGTRERAIADLQLNHVLAPSLQRPRHREHGERSLRGEVPRQCAQPGHQPIPLKG